MQEDRQRRQKLSRLRLELLELLERLRKTLEVVWARRPLIKGTVYQIARRCGTPHCRCTRGQLHRNLVLTWSDQGRHYMRALSPARVAEIREKSKEYARFRRAQTALAAMYSQMLSLVEQIRELRREKP